MVSQAEDPRYALCLRQQAACAGASGEMLSHREDHVNGTGPDSTDVGYGVAARWFRTDRGGVMMPSRRRKKKDGDLEAEVVLLHHVSRPGVDPEHEAAQGDVKHATGGGQADADGVQAPSAGSGRGRPSRNRSCRGAWTGRSASVEPWERYVQFSSAGVMKNRPRPAPCAGSRHVYAPLGDLVAAPAGPRSTPRPSCSPPALR